MADDTQVQGVPQGLTEEELPKAHTTQVQGVPLGLTEEPIASAQHSTIEKTENKLGLLDTANEYYEKGTGVLPAVGRLALTPVNMGRSIYHAFADEPTEKENKEIPSIVRTSPVSGAPNALGRIALAGKRLLYDPQAAEAQKAEQEAEKGHTAESMGHSIAAGIPLVGPYAANLGERAGRGDVSGAVTEGLGMALAPEIAKEALPGGALPGAAPEGARALPITDSVVRGASKGVGHVLPAAPYVAGTAVGHPYVGARLYKSLVPEALENTVEKGKVYGLSPEEAAHQQLEERADKSYKEAEKTKSTLDRYKASTAQGIEPPEDVVKANEKAQARAAEDRLHADNAKEALNKPQVTEEKPVETDHMAGLQGDIDRLNPRVNAAETVKTPARPINVKGPGEIKPENITQPLTERPTVDEGKTVPLAEGEGLKVGKPKLLAEKNPEPSPLGSAVKQEVLSPEKTAKPERGNLRALRVDEKGNILDKEETPEGRLETLIRKGLEPEKKGPLGKINTPPSEENVATAKPQPKVEIKEPVENRESDRRVADENHAGEERRKSERRVLNDINQKTFQESVFGGGEKGIDTDAYAKATEQARKELGPDASTKEVMKRRDELVAPEAKGVTSDIGAKAREENPEPKRAETKGKPEPVAKAERTPEAALDEPAVSEQVSNLKDESLKKLARAHDLDPEQYDFKARDEGRHRTERDQLVKDITAKMSDDEVQNLARSAQNADKLFDDKDRTGAFRAEKAEKVFPRLRGPVDEFGNPKISGGSQGAEEEVPKKATGYSLKADERYPATSTVGTTEGAKSDTEHFANAKKELGENASISDVAKRAQEMKEQASKPVDLKKTVNNLNKTEGLGEVKDNKLEADPRRKEIARAYDDMKHDPNNPEVKKSYSALIEDAKKQWDALTKAGVKLKPQDEDPYKSYDEMKKDFDDNKRLKVFRGGNELPADHPLAQVDPKTGETYNVMLRGVHDVIGHLMHDNDFSEKGENNAFDTHRQTMSKEAVPALTTETKAQVASFFNDGEKFPDQKAGILPERFTEDAPDAKPVLEHLKYGKDYALLTAENPNNERATPEQNAQKNQEMKAELEKMGYKPTPIEGHVKDVEGQKENSFFVPDITPEDAAKVSRKFGQASVMTKQGIHASTGIMESPEAEKQDYHSTVAGKPFSVSVDFDKEEQPHNSKGSPMDEFGNPTVSGGSQSAAGTAKVGKLPKLAEEHLSEEEKAGVTKSEAGRKSFVNHLKDLPSVQEFTDIAKAGEGGRKWYERSGKAFDALSEEAPRYFKEGDRQKFTDFVAALSPQQTVKMNLGEALNAWTKYVDEGRPEGKPLEKLLKDELTLPGAKVPNATKALAGEPLWPDLSKNSNFKVPSFAKNLRGYLDHVTNDGWQGLFGGLNGKELSKPTSYHPLSVVTRAAADALGWKPAEAQSAIWAFTKTFTEKGEVDPKVIRRYSEDFADIMAHDPEIRQQLAQLGVSHEQLDAKLRAIGRKPEVTPGASPTTEGSIRKLSKRIEEARGKGTIPPPKSGYLGFDEEPDEDSEFNFGHQETPELDTVRTNKNKSKLGRIGK